MRSCRCPATWWANSIPSASAPARSHACATTRGCVTTTGRRMRSAEVTVVNKLGIHARPSARITQVATGFSSEVWMTRKGRRINAKSIMGVMMLAAGKGSTLLIETEGEDEDEALAALVELIESGFGEEIE